MEHASQSNKGKSIAEEPPRKVNISSGDQAMYEQGYSNRKYMQIIKGTMTVVGSLDTTTEAL